MAALVGAVAVAVLVDGVVELAEHVVRDGVDGARDSTRSRDCCETSQLYLCWSIFTPFT